MFTRLVELCNSEGEKITRELGNSVDLAELTLRLNFTLGGRVRFSVGT